MRNKNKSYESSILVLGYFLVVHSFELRKEVQPYKVFYEYMTVAQPNDQDVFKTIIDKAKTKHGRKTIDKWIQERQEEIRKSCKNE